MMANLNFILDVTLAIQDEFPGGMAFEVKDYSLFMYGLVRGDRLVAATHGAAVYHELVVYELDGVFRLGIVHVRRKGWLSRLSGLFTASRAEFDLKPEQFAALASVGSVVAVLDSALRGPRGGRAG